MNEKEIQKILKAVAKKQGKSVDVIRAEIENTILSAYVFPNEDALSVPRNGEVPTISEFLEFATFEVKTNISPNKSMDISKD